MWTRAGLLWWWDMRLYSTGHMLGSLEERATIRLMLQMLVFFCITTSIDNASSLALVHMGINLNIRRKDLWLGPPEFYLHHMFFSFWTISDFLNLFWNHKTNLNTFEFISYIHCLEVSWHFVYRERRVTYILQSYSERQWRMIKNNNKIAGTLRRVRKC